jgi:succinate dehydrogenase / fumarate reductase cytochrome b subunit
MKLAIALHFSSMAHEKKRPKFLNLLRIHLPVMGVTSFAHRVSGAVLFLSIPLLIYLFNLSIKSPQGFQQALAMLDSQTSRLILTILTWAFVHHLLAGIRFLLIDIEVGAELPMARKTAWLVNLGGALAFLVLAYVIWL